MASRGIIARVVRDTVSDNGRLVEDTLDWYAQDAEGNAARTAAMRVRLERQRRPDRLLGLHVPEHQGAVGGSGDQRAPVGRELAEGDARCLSLQRPADLLPGPYQAWPWPHDGHVTPVVTAAVKALPQPHTYRAASSGAVGITRRMGFRRPRPSCVLRDCDR
jgi:hypothetical protein